MEFRVLGPLEVVAAGQPLPLGGRKQRAVLALLLLDVNRVVSRERLISDVWGSEPPANAEANLRVYVARLRKLLSASSGAPSVLETTPHGYVLRIEPETLDVNRFRRLTASGEEALAAGRADDAAAALAAALRLWRGPPLADLVEDEWARREAAVLDDLRLRALEARIEADLAAGRDAELVPELDALVGEHRHRERLVAHLMLALYRSGRQTDALDVYSRASRSLRDDFGLEPTRSLRELQRSILVQAPALELQPARSAAGSGRRRRSRLGPTLAVAAALAVSVGVALAPAIGDEGPTPLSFSAPLRGNSLVVVDPTSMRIAGEVPVGGRPTGVVAGFGSMWVGNRDDGTLLRIDPRTRRVVETIGLGAEPSDLAVGDGSVWIISNASSRVLEVDPAVNDVVGSKSFRSLQLCLDASKVVFFRHALWISTCYHAHSLVRVDARTYEAGMRFRYVNAVAATPEALWATGGVENDRVRRLEPPGEAVRLGTLGAIHGLGGLVANGNVLWIGSLDGTLWRIDPATGRVTTSAPLRRRIADAALGEGDLWLVTVDRSLLRVDSTSGRLTGQIQLGVFPTSRPHAIAAAGGSVWIAALER